MFETTTGGVQRPKRALATILDSHSKTTSLIPTSHAKNTPTSWLLLQLLAALKVGEFFYLKLP